MVEYINATSVLGSILVIGVGVLLKTVTGMRKEFLAKETHDLVCEKQQAVIMRNVQNMVHNKIDEATDDIKEAIKEAVNG